MFIFLLGTGTVGGGGQEPEASERMKDSCKAYDLGNRSNLNYKPRSQSLLPSAPLVKPLGQLVHGWPTEEPFTAWTLPSRAAGGWDPLPFIQLPRHFVDRTQII